MTIRKAVEGDLKGIHEVFSKAIEITAAPYYSSKEVAAWVSSVNHPERWTIRIQEDFVLVIEENNKIIGFASLKNGNYLDLLFVHPSHGRKGIATQLLTKLEEQRNKSESLETHASLISKAFFAKNGYEFIRANKVDVFGVEMENYLMRKSQPR